MKSTIVGSSGYEANVTSDGKLEVSTNLGTVTVTDVTIKDATTGTNKLKVNADGSVNIVHTGSIGTTQIRAARSGALAAGTTEVLLSTNYPTVIDYIEWAQNHATFGELQIQIRMSDNSLQLLRTLTPQGSSTGVRWRPSDFQNNGFPRLIDVIMYNDGQYKFATNDVFSKMAFPHGIVISCINTDASYADLTMAALVIGRRVT